ncbi:hypothetical protein [Kutzneria sp. NPDC051319]|uniref:hypothetical protein n=1 Tax=Kutzneria sp. NPDC051319 TaxID=3155047 RepID=UPI00341E9DE8
MTEHTVRATPAERAESRPGDDIVSPADVVMDRGFTVDAPPDSVWPWLVQLGKRRAGWYFPRAVERFLPPRRRALRRLDPRWTTLAVGDVIPDYGRDETFEVAAIQPPHTLVYTSRRGHTLVSWSITLRPLDTTRTRVLLRLRLGPVKHRRLADTLGGFFDFATIAGMAAGLRERLEVTPD